MHYIIYIDRAKPDKKGDEDMEKLKVAVIFGGKSNEHDISLISATHIINSIPRDKYDVITIGITKEGSWLRFEGAAENIKNGKWVEDEGNIPCVLSPDPVDSGFIAFEKDGSVSKLKVDCIFPALHGKNGEDGTIQGLFQMSQIAFVGCDMISSACCMDKEFTHRILESCGVKMAKWVSVRITDKDILGERCAEIEEKLCYPLFIKPSRSGSSVGISKAYNTEQLKTGILSAFEHDSKVVVEQGIVGTECECAVMGNNELIVSTIGEIAPANDFYDFESKYNDPTEQTYIPARFSQDKIEEIRKQAEKSYRGIGCEGLARVDFFLTDKGEVVLNEINTLPGHTPISMYPKLMENCGIDAQEEMDRLITLALKRAGR